MKLTSTLMALSIVSAATLFIAPPAHAETAASKEAGKVYVTVQAGDYLEKIATEQKTTFVRIFDANDQLSNPDAINPGDKLRIPKDDEQLPDRYGNYLSTLVVTVPTTGGTTVAAASNTTRQYTSKPVNSNSYYVGNGMWCTDYVHSMRPDVPVYGNAGYGWISAAQADGKSTGTTAQAGAVAVQNGHVAYVKSVNGDGSYVVQEMGWNYQAGNYNERTVSAGTFGAFIY